MSKIRKQNGQATELEIHIIKCSYLCDGCAKHIKSGEKVLNGIASCCGGGCTRILCAECITAAYLKLNN